MTMHNLNFDETKQSQLPFVELLINMGYRYIPTAEINKERGEDMSKFILRKTAREKLMEINQYERNGETYKFTEKDVEEAIDDLENIPMEGIVDTSRKIYGMIMPNSGGKTIKVARDGRNTSENFRFIDFKNPENNDFSVNVEFKASGKGNIRPDIVVFVNGIPFAVIENKKASVSVDEAINQQNRNQKNEKCPKLFIYPQILVAANKEDFKYGTLGTPKEFYARWKEKSIDKAEQDQKTEKLIQTSIDTGLYKQILQDLNGATYGHTQKISRKITHQDRSVVALFEKGRLLDLTKNFVLYDGGIKKIMRYQQYFAIKKILKRIETVEMGKFGERRQGGLVWHTQGSGKSLTMVMFVKALIEDPNIKNPRILIVTDRKDLDRQIKTTFINAGLKKDTHQATSGENLLTLIKKKDRRVITTLIQKFQSANKNVGFEDLDSNIFVLIDEAHRNQGGDANLEMNKVIPNACYIAFTGTPLLKKDTSKNKFGGFIDKYTIDDALDDGIILPLIYEGRYVDLKQDKDEIDRLTDRITTNLNEKLRFQLQNIAKTILKDNPRRITEISVDIEKHYLSRFAGTGLKAQIVAPSKFSAVLFQKYFQSNEKIKTALVISDENGIIDEKNEHKKEVEEYLKEIKDKHQSLVSYEKEVIDSFKHNDDGIEILIVVDKLLTGFDAPRNTVLYLSKELRDHNLLQAIARVNRLYDNKSLPKTAGYIIDYSENALNIKTAMQLFGSYDENDVKSALIDVQEKIDELESSYGDLDRIFKAIPNDDEAYLQHLAHEPDRKQFYDTLNKFLQSFKECMVLQDFAHEFKHLDVYRNELKKFMELRKIASFRYADTVDFSRYKQALVKIMDENIKAEEAELLTKQIVITDKEVFERAVEEMGSDKSKAEAIASQTERTISEMEEKDPVFYKRFSQKISELLEAMRLKKIADIEALKQARLIHEQVMNKEDDELPEILKDSQGADIFYRNLKEKFESFGMSDEVQCTVILDIFNILKKETIVDFHRQAATQRVIKNKLDDYLYDEVKLNMKIDISHTDLADILDDIINLALENHEIF
jgi:type I restriction enzyme, R subunit